jgi:hypothetical protein
VKVFDNHQRAVTAVVSEMRKTLGLEPRVAAGRGGHRFDVLAETPDGHAVGVEIKDWREPDEEMVRKAEYESGLLVEQGKLASAFVVIPNLPDRWQTGNVINLDGFASALDGLDLLADFGVRGVRGGVGVGEATGEKQIFVAMPFAGRYDDTYFLGILPAARRAGATCQRLDVNYVSGQTLALIHAGIESCDLVIADLSEGNANVTYELGYAHALRKPAVHISSTPAQELPFDLRQWQTIDYALGQVYLLTSELERVLPRMLDLEAPRVPSP